MLQWLRSLHQGLLLHMAKAAVEEVDMGAVEIDAEITTEMVAQIEITMAETVLARTELQLSNLCTKTL